MGTPPRSSSSSTGSPSLVRVAIFPLSSIQLFPHALLPLHIFEPRYRAMTRACLEGDRRFAICALETGASEATQEHPAVRPLCGLGEIVAHDELPDGRYHLLVRGLARIRITRELRPPTPYRMVEAELARDLYRPGVDLSLARRSLLAICERLAAALPSGGDTLRALCRETADPSSVADVLAAALVTAPEARQELLETLDVAARLDRVSDLVAALLTRFLTTPTMAN